MSASFARLSSCAGRFDLGAAASLLDPTGCFAVFGELADESKIGELPSDEDLMMQLFEPPPPPPYGLFSAATPTAAPFLCADWLPPNSAPPPASDPALGGFGPSMLPSSCDLLRCAHPAGLPGVRPGPGGAPSAQPPARGAKRRSEYADPDRPGVVKRATLSTESEEEEEEDNPRGAPRRRHDIASLPAAAYTHHAAVRGSSHARAGGADGGTTAPPAGAPAAAEAAVVYRGVSRHRLTQRWEASLWLAGRQLYLGGFDSQEDAARAYDLAALACKGHDAIVNFPAQEYARQLAEVHGFSREEVVAYVRRRSAAFSRGKSRHRGVSGHNGRWEARIGSFGGKKNVSFGVFETEEGAARQYDRALILEKQRSAKTNFPLRQYEAEVAEYEAYLIEMCGALHGPAAARAAEEYTLPRDRVATADEKKRSAIIYGEALRRALGGSA